MSLSQFPQPPRACQPPQTTERDRLVTAIRCAMIALLMSKSEIEIIRVALRGHLISVAQALDWLEELGAMPLIETVWERNRE